MIMSCNSRLSSSLTTGSNSTMPKLQQRLELISTRSTQTPRRLTHRPRSFCRSGPGPPRLRLSLCSPVIAGSLDDGAHAAVPHGKPFTGHAP